MKERILQVAESLFYKFGIKSVTMDDISKDLGISKKTIYQHFSDKKNIVFEVAKIKIDQERALMVQAKNDANDPIEEFFMTQKIFQDLLSQINPSVFFDLQRYYPKVWALHLNQKQFFREFLLETLNKGKDLGLFLDTMNLEILSKFHIEATDIGFNSEVYPHTEFNLIEVQNCLMENFVRGILTPKGQELYEKYNSK